MNYFEFHKRLLTFKKYPLFRTVPFRYLLLNILLVSLFISLPYMVSMAGTLTTLGELKNVENEIPEFSIDNGQYKGEEKTLTLNESEVVFTSSKSRDEVNEINDDTILAFLSDGIYIAGFQNSTFNYSLIGDVNDKERLEEFVNSQMSSIYFYVFIYILIYVIVIYFFIFTLMLILSSILSGIAKALNKKTDYMNWFKLGSYAVVIPSLLIGILAVLTSHYFWFILILAIPSYFYYYKKLPVKKKTKSKA